MSAEEIKGDLLKEEGEGGKLQNKDIGFIFNPARDNFPAKPYYEDGNPELYSSEKWKSRQELKNDSTVQESIREFMNLFHKTGNGIITKDEYFRVFLKVGMILRPGIDPDDL